MKKTRFKIVAAAAALAMAFALAGCSGGTDATTDDGNDTGGTSGTGTETTDPGTTDGSGSGSGDSGGSSSGGTEYDVITTTDTTYKIERPTLVNGWSSTVSNNTVTFSGNSAAYWALDTLEDYSTVEIVIKATSLGTEDYAGKVSIKGSDVTNGMHGDVDYPTATTESQTLSYTISDFKTKVTTAGGTKVDAIIFANNANDNDWSNGPAWGADWTLAVESILLTKITAKEDVVIFDPGATGFTTPDGMEVVEKNSEKFLKVTPSGYSTSIELASPVSIKGYLNFKATAYSDSGEGWQFTIGLRDYTDGLSDDEKSVGNLTHAVTVDVVTITGAIGGSKSAVTAIQPFTQLTTGNWDSQSDKIIYIGKIVATTDE